MIKLFESPSEMGYSKTLESIQDDPLLEEAGTSIFGPFTNDIPILPFEYEYRFTEDEYEYEKNQWYELPATIMPDGPFLVQPRPPAAAFRGGRRLRRRVSLTSLTRLTRLTSLTADEIDVIDRP